MPSFCLLLAMGMLGVTFVISQVLGLREFLVLSQGNELSIGIVLGNWLLAAGMGSALAGRNSARSRDPLRTFVTLQMLVSVLLPVTLVLIRTSRHLLGISPWEALSFARIAWTSLLLMGPVAMGGGAMFVYGCRLLEKPDFASSQAPGMAYVLESAGAVVGGVLSSYLWVGRLHPIQIALLLGTLNLASSLLLLAWRDRTSRSGGLSGFLRRNRWCQTALLLFFLSVVLLGSTLADRIQRWSYQVRWSPLEFEESADSVYGNITVLKLGDQTIFYQNGIPSITTPVPDVAALEERVHLPLLAHADPRDVLFLGGGVGGALAEALKHPLRSLVYAELDPTLIRTVERTASPLIRAELSDPRTRVVHEDGRFFLRGTAQRFDAILVLLPDATTLQLNRFFTREFFELVRTRLDPDGIFAFSMPGSTAYLNEELLVLNRCVQETLKQVFPVVRILPGERNLFLGSVDVRLEELTAEILEKRMMGRRIQTRALGGAYLRYLMDPMREEWIRKELEQVPFPGINRDFLPLLVHGFLAYQHAEIEGGARGGFWSLAKLPPKWISWGLLLGGLSLFLWLRLLSPGKQRDFALSFSIFTSGLVGMALEMTGILFFQCIFGYLYHWIGLLIAAFMGGLALGAYAMNLRLRDIANGYRVFLLLEALQFCYVLLLAMGLVPLAGAFHLGGNSSWLSMLFFVALMVIAGALVGAEFPLATKESSPRAYGEISGRAGSLYALDLGGAFIGTLLVGVVLVPWIGIPCTLLLAGVLKAVSFFYLCLAR